MATSALLSRFRKGRIMSIYPMRQLKNRSDCAQYRRLRPDDTLESFSAPTFLPPQALLDAVPDSELFVFLPANGWGWIRKAHETGLRYFVEVASPTHGAATRKAIEKAEKEFQAFADKIFS